MTHIWKSRVTLSCTLVTYQNRTWAIFCRENKIAFLPICRLFRGSARYLAKFMDESVQFSWNSRIGRDFVITGCLTVDPLETTDKLPKIPRLVGYPKLKYPTSRRAAWTNIRTLRSAERKDCACLWRESARINIALINMPCVVLKIFLKFDKFKPHGSYKKNSYKKETACIRYVIMPCLYLKEKWWKQKFFFRYQTFFDMRMSNTFSNALL